jgi:hypothetical protein
MRASGQPVHEPAKHFLTSCELAGLLNRRRPESAGGTSRTPPDTAQETFRRRRWIRNTRPATNRTPAIILIMVVLST